MMWDIWDKGQRKRFSTSGLVLLYDVFQGVVPEKLSEGSILTEQLLVRAHLWHPAFHHHHDVIHLGQEANAMCHQNACLESNNKIHLVISQTHHADRCRNKPTAKRTHTFYYNLNFSWHIQCVPSQQNQFTREVKQLSSEIGTINIKKPLG